MARAMARTSRYNQCKLLMAVKGSGFSTESSTVALDWTEEPRGEKIEEGKQDLLIECKGYNGSLWIPHKRTGIYYPVGHERVMEDVPASAALSKEVHVFSSWEDVHVHFPRVLPP